MLQHLSIATLFLCIVIPFGVYLKQKKKSASFFKKTLFGNIVSFFSVLLFVTVVLFADSAKAADADVTGIANGLAYIGAALSTGLGSLGAGIATGSAASSALGALSENEGIMGKALIFVALAEGIAIYGLIISFMILNSI